MIKKLIALSAGVLTISPAHAALLDYSYTLFNGSVVQGSLIGSVSPDGKTFDISSDRSLSVDGTPVSGNPQVVGTDAFFLNSANPPAVALDKSLVDFSISPNAPTSLIFAVGDRWAAQSFGLNEVQASPLAGGDGLRYQFDPADLTLTVLQDATLDFSYKLGTGSVVAGSLSGWASTNGSLFQVGGVNSLSVNGTPVAGTPQVLGTDVYAFGSGKAPSVALDKSLVDFTITPAIGTSLTFAVGDNVSKYFAQNKVEAAPVYGGDGTLGPFDPADLTLGLHSFSSTVPEPASWVMLILGCAAVGGTMRRRRLQTVNADA